MTARKATAAAKKATAPRAPRAPKAEAADDGLRPLHSDESAPAPIFAYEHPHSGALVLDESATRDGAGRAVNK